MFKLRRFTRDVQDHLRFSDDQGSSELESHISTALSWYCWVVGRSLSLDAMGGPAVDEVRKASVEMDGVAVVPVSFLWSPTVTVTVTGWIGPDGVRG